MKKSGIVKKLLEKFPEFAASLDQEIIDLPYVVYGYFAEYIFKRVKSWDDAKVNELAIFLDELATTNDDTRNILQMGVIEVLLDDQEVLEVIYKASSQKVQSEILAVQKFWKEKKHS